MIRLSILVQGAALRAPRGAVPMQPQVLTRGVRPPAGPRVARGCEAAQSLYCEDDVAHPTVGFRQRRGDAAALLLE